MPHTDSFGLLATMLCAATLLLLVGVAVGREPPLAQQWFSQNSISLVDRAQAGPPARNQRSFAEAIESKRLLLLALRPQLDNLNPSNCGSRPQPPPHPANCAIEPRDKPHHCQEKKEGREEQQQAAQHGAQSVPSPGCCSSVRSITGAVLAVGAVNLPTIDGRPGSFWVDGEMPCKAGAAPVGCNPDYTSGISCDTTCMPYSESDYVSGCESQAFGELTSQAAFEQASSLACESGYHFNSGASDFGPYKTKTGTASTNKCFYTTGGQCSPATDGGDTRVCPCKCPIGTYQPDSGIVTACIA